MPNTPLIEWGNLAQTLEEESARREQIREKVRELDAAVRQMVSALSAVHSTPESDFPKLAVHARTHLPLVCQTVAALAVMVPQWQFYRYSDMWSRSAQSASFCVTLIGWLEVDRLVTKEEVASTLAIDQAWKDHFILTTEDYLHSLISLISELARLCPNSVTLAAASGAPITVPLRVSRFCKDLSAGFALLNLKNDSLRKRFDGIKYDLKAIEQVMFDITLRGLLPKEMTQADRTAKRLKSTEESRETITE